MAKMNQISPGGPGTRSGENRELRAHIRPPDISPVCTYIRGT
jgi:hypothetical protein